MRCHWVIGAALALIIATPTPAPPQDVRAARTLRAGTVLREADLTLPDGNGADARERIAVLVGLETRRAIYTGRPVVAADLGPPTLVRRNAVVEMIYSDRGLGIRTEGRALESGGAGEVVRVINLTSRQSILATVTGPNQVAVHR
jgi:flagella basal body P-ring formation protein FlgA